MFNVTWVNVVQVTKTIFNNVTYLIGQFINLRAGDYNINNIQMITPYGHSGYAPDGLQGIVTKVNGSNKSYVCLGFSTSLPTTIPYTINKGDAYQYNLKYILINQANGIRAYKIGDTTYNTTLNNGEFMGQMMLNRIAEINKIYTYVQSLAAFVNYTPPVVTPPSLSTDQQYINNQNYLINDNGTIYGA